MNKKGFAWGLIFILVAAYLVVSQLGLLPAISPIRIIFTIIFAAIAISGLYKLSFFQFFFPIALIGCMFDKELGITAITPWTLILVSILLAIGFNMIFKGFKKKRKVIKQSRVFVAGNDRVDNSQDGEIVNIDNNFSDYSKYINSMNVKMVNADNSFGQLSIYFNNAALANGSASLAVDNNFGQTNVYIPKTWQIELTKDSAFGGVKIIGEGSNDPAAPKLYVSADVSFGEVDIIFE